MNEPKPMVIVGIVLAGIFSVALLTIGGLTILGKSMSTPQPSPVPPMTGTISGTVPGTVSGTVPAARTGSSLAPAMAPAPTLAPAPSTAGFTGTPAEIAYGEKYIGWMKLIESGGKAYASNPRGGGLSVFSANIDTVWQEHQNTPAPARFTLCDNLMGEGLEDVQVGIIALKLDPSSAEANDQVVKGMKVIGKAHDEIVRVTSS